MVTEFDRLKESDAKNCKKGMPCGNSCIAQGKKCKSGMAPKAAAIADHLSDLANLEEGAESSENNGEENNSSQPSNEFKGVQIREDALKDKRSEIVDRFGKKLVNKAEENIQRIINENDVMIRVPSEYIDSIINEGRMLNSGEVRERGIQLDPSYASERIEDATYQGERDGSEERAMGIPSDTPPSERPIYGYVGNSSDMNAPHQKNVEVYGDVAFTLKAEAKERSSLTTGDSFEGGLSSKSGEFNAGSFSAGGIRDTGNRIEGSAKSKTIDDVVQKTGSPYLEYQIQGGVKTSDIAEMHFTNGKQPTESTVKWAEKNGVKIFTYD